jgi:hypothetical protein
MGITFSLPNTTTRQADVHVITSGLHTIGGIKTKLDLDVLSRSGKPLNVRIAKQSNLGKNEDPILEVKEGMAYLIISCYKDLVLPSCRLWKLHCSRECPFHRVNVSSVPFRRDAFVGLCWEDGEVGSLYEVDKKAWEG